MKKPQSEHEIFSNQLFQKLISGEEARKLFRLVSILLVLTILLFLPDLFFFLKNGIYDYAFTGLVIVAMLLMVPVVLFARRLRIYYYILSFFACLTPIMLLPVLLVNSLPNAEMLGLVLETNYHEVTELLGWKLVLLPILMVVFFVLFLRITRLLPQKIAYKKGALISGICILAFLSIPFLRTMSYRYNYRCFKIHSVRITRFVLSTRLPT
ncbi:MAG TPA: hypothetical protein VM187_15815 [Niastella sp.]|nr:hypothetical protein [Niastella sp.]